jgi:DNA modification methylase
MSHKGPVASMFADEWVTLYCGDAWELAGILAPQSVNTVVTSPPYWGLRDYGCPGQFGLEATPDEYVAKLVDLFARLRPALRDDGTVWLNLGDSYTGGGRGGNPEESVHRKQSTNVGSMMAPSPVPPGLKPKDLVGIPWRVAFALQADGWYLRSDIIWHKPNPMPESVTDRPTKSHEYIFLLSKQPRYYYDADAIREPHKWADDPRNDGERHTYSDDAKYNQSDPKRQSTKTDCVSFHPNGRNKRSVWTVSTKPFSAAHFATFPPDLIKPCILAGCPDRGTVLDPFMGSGTTAQVARSLGRKSVGFELNADYLEIALKHRLSQGVLP